MLNIACSAASPLSVALITAFFACRGDFMTTLAYVYQCLLGSKHFCTCSRQNDLQKPLYEPSTCSTARIYDHVSETMHLMVKMLLEIIACKSRWLHWGFGTKNIWFCSEQVQRPISRWGRSCITSASGTAWQLQ